MWKKSLRCRFTFTLILPVLAVLALSGVAGYFSARHEVDEIYDAQLANLAKTLMGLMEHEALEGDTSTGAIMARFREASHEYEKYTAIRIWNGDQLFFYTKSAQTFGPKHVIAGFSNKMIERNQWRFFVLPDDNLNFTVEVAEDYAVRQDLIGKIIQTMFIPFAALLLLLPFLLWLGLRYGLKPLLVISGMVGQRSPDDLSPIPLERTPSEILPLAHAINGLMARVDEALIVERRFTDHAAHELRTPLAVIKTQLQNVINAKSEAEREELLRDLSAGVQRASLMVAQLLSLARLGQENMKREPILLNEAVRAIAQEMMPLALAKQIQVEFIEEEAVRMELNAEALSIVVRNLFDNAVKYTPQGGHITLILQKQQGDVILEIADSGDGIPEDKLALVTERFYRVPGNQETGSGLGLTIAARGAEAIGAELTLYNRKAGGLVARLYWRS